jgi:metal-responsive CopG/Arc/MetJ family transcriptional regulator
MKRIRVVLEGELFEALDRAARATGRSRSALVRDALQEHLREHLRRWEIRWMEDRVGYARRPVTREEWSRWEAAAAWPEE